MSSLRHFVFIFVPTVLLVLCIFGTFALASTYPQLEEFSNDQDELYEGYDYVPQNGLGPPVDPDFGGVPPAEPSDEDPEFPFVPYWRDIRNGGSGMLEEVPVGTTGNWTAGVPASHPGNTHYGLLQFRNGNGPAGFPGYATTMPSSPWSYQLDIYADGRNGYTNPGAENGSNGIPDFWWTNGVNPNGSEGYLTETGFSAEVLRFGQDQLGNDVKRWHFTTTAGAPIFDAPVNKWYTLEVKYFEVTSGPNAGHLGAIHNIYNIEHTSLLGSYTLNQVFLNPTWAQTGGPRYSWFAYPEANIQYLTIDNVGVGPAIVIDRLKGDMDGDHDVDNFDIQPFEQALTDPAGYNAAHPTISDRLWRGDIDDNGSFDNFDIQLFEALLTGGGGAAFASAVVPEPSSIILLCVGGLTALARLGVRRFRRAA